ncbi:MAG: hypothetical protein QFF03_18765 [Pseudomonadota bacterium]|nr:hypothetical protein [Pseudomonadota bacterium]
MKTLSDHLLGALAAAVSAWVVLASAYLFYITPARPWPYGLALAVIVAAWIARGVADPAARRKVTQAIVLAGALLGLTLLIPLGWAPGAAGQFAERGMGVVMGVIVVAFANVIPKRAGSARTQALRRVAGWALVLGGLGYALAWLLMPLAYANLAALLVLLLGFAYAAARIGWSLLKHRPATPQRPG